MDTRPLDLRNGLSRVIVLTAVLSMKINYSDIKYSFAADPS